jgi:hypothetical protein
LQNGREIRGGVVVAEEQRGANINPCRSSGYCRLGSNCEDGTTRRGVKFFGFAGLQLGKQLATVLTWHLSRAKFHPAFPELTPSTSVIGVPEVAHCPFLK